MRADRRAAGAAALQQGQVRPRLVALTTKVYFDGGCRPNPGAIEVAAVMRGKVHLRFDLGDGSSGDAEWCALLHALDIAAAARERDIVLLGDSASVIDQAKGIARRRLARDDEARFIALSASFDRLRFRRIRRHQNLAGIALDQLRRRRPVR